MFSPLGTVVAHHSRSVLLAWVALAVGLHLVAPRWEDVTHDGDLAYLHVHPEGDEPGPGARSGPTVSFMTEAPTAGRYLLYFDFQVDGNVHTARFVLDAAPGTTEQEPSQHDQHR